MDSEHHPPRSTSVLPPPHLPELDVTFPAPPDVSASPLLCPPLSWAAEVGVHRTLNATLSPNQVPSSMGVQTTRFPAADGKIVTWKGSDGFVADGEFEAEEDKKTDREYKKRSKNWSRAESLTLIRLRSHLAPRFARTGRKTELWDEIADSLQKSGRFCRDAQQCRDKWEKLVAGYREVREGFKQREDNPFYDELHPLLVGRLSRRDRDQQDALVEDCDGSAPHRSSDAQSQPIAAVTRVTYEDGALNLARIDEIGKSKEDHNPENKAQAWKKRRTSDLAAVANLHAVQNLLETIICRQQKFFRELLEAMERKELLREQVRQEREERWRAEERAQRLVFTEAMVILTQKLGGERVAAPSGVPGALVCSSIGHEVHKKRSKNWKRGEVLQLIKLRGEMENKFSTCTRRAGLWEELAETLGSQGIKRDAKQCREKWEKLMSAYKDVLDGKRDQAESPYFTELAAIVGERPGEAA